MTWKYPWAISGVDEIGLDVARVLAFTATGGAEGIVAPTDLKVTQLSTAGTSVQIAKGAFSCLNKYSTGVSESYIGYNDGTVTAPIASTSGSSRYDMVYAHITDPGQPNNPVTATQVQTRVIQGVPSTATKLSDVSGYSNVAGYALARILIPANTSAITNAMITDLRTILQPKQQSAIKVYNTPNSGSDTTVTTTMAGFPSPASWNIPIPVWANRMTVVCLYIRAALSTRLKLVKPLIALWPKGMASLNKSSTTPDHYVRKLACMATFSRQRPSFFRHAHIRARTPNFSTRSMQPIIVDC